MRPLKNGSPSLYVRLLAIAAVAAAPLLPPVHREGKGRAVMLVVDRSGSIGSAGRAAAQTYLHDAWEARGDTRVGMVAFDGVPELRRAVGASGDEGAPVLGTPSQPGTDVAAAIRLAAAALPDAGERRIVLLSDGRATRGDALAEVRRAEQRGIAVDTVPIGTPDRDAPVIARLSPREPRVADGEPATVIAEIRGKPDSRVTVSWSRDGKRLRAAETVRLGPDGTAKAVFTDAHPGAGTHVYEAHLTAQSGATTQPSYAAVDVAGKPHPLVVSFDGECPGVLADALDQAGVERVKARLGETRIDAATLSGADLVVLADVPLTPGDNDDAGLSPKAQEALIEFAQKGGGVFVTAGAFGFAPEYEGTPLARMLPVEIENQGQLEDPKVSMAIMLDRSGSMAATVGTHTKIQLAVEAALAAASTLRPDDVLALGSVDTLTTWNQPLGPVSGLAARRDHIRSIDAGGGGIYVYTALVDAYAALRKAVTPVRHVILFADTADAEEQAERCYYGPCSGASNTAGELAETARRMGITTSVVGIGREQDSDTAFLRKLAASGGGRFYLTGNAAELRRIFVSEARVATRSNLREGPVDVVVAEDHPILAGVDVSAFPPLGGFVEARRRATADTALQTRGGEPRPILASWRYGLGKVVALTTDLRADWKNGWTAYHGAGQVLRQAVRFALRRHGAAAADVRVAVNDHGAVLSVDVGDAPSEETPRAVEAFAFGPDGVLRPVAATLDRVAPGRFEARVPSKGQPFVLARVRDASGALLGEAVGQSDAADELAVLGPDERALRELARAGGGAYDRAPADAMIAAGRRAREPVPLWPYALVAAAGLAAIDLWLRRLGKPRANLARAGASTPAPVRLERPAAPHAQAA